MQTCRKCSNEFPWSVVIEGVKRFLNGRKYCLDCSPFGERNTRQLHDGDDNNPNRICSTCSRSFVFDSKQRVGHKKNTCNSCVLKTRRYRFKAEGVAMLGGSCRLCGYDRCLQALQFHHLDPTKKDFVISRSAHKTWEAVKKEIEKCVLLCVRCHAEVHAGFARVS